MLRDPDPATMTSNNPDQKASVDIRISQLGPGRPEAEAEEEEEENDEEDLEKLGSDVKHMANKILEYRANLPEQLKSTFTSILSAQRPFLTGIDSEAGTSGGNPRDSGLDKVGKKVAAEAEQKNALKISLLKDKISSNVSAMPNLLKRMNDCISRIEKLDSYDGIIHLAFKRKRTS
ncbi:hypothetical protein HS088_TW17G00584 [Tripterygium wilfordii]|uniref:Uncharacterized protein n=1 Tax=Tripterygium wilfordii TaxID=458696 RepID=A0A7J7CG74_TRIWF|nr:uncharacterized protein LOC119982114 [Tripterygium wilfordii]KAF5733049.1 hypothetical protein HS088_TW17G00584 [Tripterygium wilfordii]